MNNSKENVLVCEHKAKYAVAIDNCLGVKDVNTYINGFEIKGDPKSEIVSFVIKITDEKDLRIPIHHVLTIEKNESFDEKISIFEEANVWFMVEVTKIADNKESIRVLQVASSNDIEKEIAVDLGLMLFVNQSKCDDSETIKAFNTQFWKKSYTRPKEVKSKDKRKYIYPKIYAELLENDNKSIEIYSISKNEYASEEFLKNFLNGLQGESSNLKNIKCSLNTLWEECEDKEKCYICEALFAFYTQALYWNASRFNADQKVINILTGYKQTEKRQKI